CLLDMGVPVRDGLLYLGVSGGFVFVDAVHSLQRVDDTLSDSAFPHDAHGMNIPSRPPPFEDLRGVPHVEALALFNRLRDFFGLMIADLGGMDNPSYVASLASVADQTWIVADQSLGGLLSLAASAEFLSNEGIEQRRLHLVINRYDSRYGLSAQQI